ncbi:hypothetical protein JXD20_00555 [Candidatus Peregrinibacteria bacterium]|nr:hypothetical protein [Candidatus Peregrinibacteria bacterium]
MRYALFFFTLFLITACGGGDNKVIVEGDCEADSDCDCPWNGVGTCNDGKCYCTATETVTETVEVEVPTEIERVCEDSSDCTCPPDAQTSCEAGLCHCLVTQTETVTETIEVPVEVEVEVPVEVERVCRAASDCTCTIDSAPSCVDGTCHCYETEVTQTEVVVDCNTNGCSCPDGVCLESGVCECPVEVPVVTDVARVHFINGSLTPFTTVPGTQGLIASEFWMTTAENVYLDGLQVGIYLTGSPAIEITQLIDSATLEINGNSVAISSAVTNVGGTYFELGEIVFGFDPFAIPALTLNHLRVKLDLKDSVPDGTQFHVGLVPCNENGFDNMSATDGDGDFVGAHPVDIACLVLNGPSITVEEVSVPTELQASMVARWEHPILLSGQTEILMARYNVSGTSQERPLDTLTLINDIDGDGVADSTLAVETVWVNCAPPSGTGAYIPHSVSMASGQVSLTGLGCYSDNPARPLEVDIAIDVSHFSQVGEDLSGQQVSLVVTDGMMILPSANQPAIYTVRKSRPSVSGPTLATTRSLTNGLNTLYEPMITAIGDSVSLARISFELVSNFTLSSVCTSYELYRGATLISDAVATANYHPTLGDTGETAFLTVAFGTEEVILEGDTVTYFLRADCFGLANGNYLEAAPFWPTAYLATTSCLMGVDCLFADQSEFEGRWDYDLAWVWSDRSADIHDYQSSADWATGLETTGWPVTTRLEY